MSAFYVARVLKSKQNEEFYWNLLHRNGNEIARSSETYKNLKDCVDAMEHLFDAIAKKEVAFQGVEAGPGIFIET